jgi:antitoxin (DNA-binding transcriptional repressor) of toxin-antitoxin stability system
MKSVGIREAKAKLPALARAAAAGERTQLTDYGKPIAVIGPLEDAQHEQRSDASAFRNALLAMPHALDIDF